MALTSVITKLTEEEAIALKASQALELKKDPEERQYLILVYAHDCEDNSFTIITGRTEARNYIINNIEEIDIKKSLILVDDVALKNSISVYQFMSAMETYFDDGFDIEQYNYTYEDTESNEEQIGTGAVQL